MTRVLLIHQAFAGPREPGGTRHFELGKYLVRNGHAFTVVASNLSYLTGCPAGSADEQIEGVRILRARTIPTLHRSFIWRVLAFLVFMANSVITALRAGPVDLVMGTTPPIFQAVSASLVAALRRRPFLLEVRDLWPEFAISMGVLKNPLLIRLSRWLEMFLYRRATHLLVNSPAYRDYLIWKGIEPRRVTLIANGVDVDAFDPSLSGHPVRDEFGLNGHFVVTYAGALGIANDIPVLLDAAAKLRQRKDVHFLVVGDGKERNNLETAARKMNLQNVTFAGSCPKSLMPEILAASDACVAILQDIPMFRTTYPNKVFDYMAAARPTILAIDGVIRDVVDAANGGLFVPPGNASALAKAVIDLSEDRERARAMGRAARAYVVRNFDRNKQAEEFLQLTERLACRR